MFTIPPFAPLAWCGVGYMLLAWRQAPAAIVVFMAAITLAWAYFTSDEPARRPLRAGSHCGRRPSAARRPVGHRPIKDPSGRARIGIRPSPAPHRITGLRRHHGSPFRPSCWPHWAPAGRAGFRGGIMAN